MLYYKVVFMLDDTQMQDILQPVSLMIIIFIIRQVYNFEPFWYSIVCSKMCCILYARCSTKCVQ